MADLFNLPADSNGNLQRDIPAGYLHPLQAEGRFEFPVLRHRQTSRAVRTNSPNVVDQALSKNIIFKTTITAR